MERRRLEYTATLTCLAVALCAWLFFTASVPWVKNLFLGLGALFLWLGSIHLINEARDMLPKAASICIRWLHAMSFEIFALLYVHLILRFLARFTREKDLILGSSVPIVLVHGYLCDWTCMTYLQSRLIKAGFGPVYIVDLGNVFGSLEEYVIELSEELGVIRQETKCAEVFLVGHSMGGLIASAYAVQAPPGRIKGVITIGSPLKGTAMAAFGILKSAHQMRPDAETVRKVQHGMQQRSDIPFYQIMTRTDELIVPADSAILGSDTSHQLILDDIGHTALLFSRRVAKKMISWLKREEKILPKT